MGSRGFSCAVSGFGQVLKRCSPRRTRERTSGTQGTRVPPRGTIYWLFLAPISKLQAVFFKYAISILIQ